VRRRESKPEDGGSISPSGGFKSQITRIASPTKTSPLKESQTTARPSPAGRLYMGRRRTCNCYPPALSIYPSIYLSAPPPPPTPSVASAAAPAPAAARHSLNQRSTYPNHPQERVRDTPGRNYPRSPGADISN
jgi:hypothetical protein